MKPICVPCQRFFRPKRTGIPFIESMPIEGRPAAGTAEPDRWTPYKLWVGDQWQCEGCGAEIASGVAPRPVAEHYQPDFADAARRLGAALVVNDC